MTFNWTDPVIIPGIGGTEVRDVHMTEVRANYKSVESSVTFNPPVNITFTDTITSGPTGPKVRAIHMTELRAAINNLEGKFSGNCECNSSLCQTCQMCQGAESCQACQSCQS